MMSEENNKEKLEITETESLSLYVRIKYMIVRMFLLMIVKPAGLDGLYRFGQFFGYCEYLIQYKKKRRIRRRMKHIFGRPLSKKEVNRIVRRYIIRIRCDKMIYTIMDKIDRKDLVSRVEILNREYLENAISRKKGTFFMFSHQGSHHLGGIFLILSGFQVMGLRDPKESKLRRFIQNEFEKTFPEFKDLEITPNDSFARNFFHAFKDNRIVAAAMDTWRTRENVRTVEVKIFGHKREIMSGMTHIALRSHASILVGFIISLPCYRYQIILHPLLNDPDKDTDAPETVQRVMQDYVKIIEEHVQKYPCHISKTAR
jgi:lauroyl/myristoyl acyltransferase